MAKKKFVWDDSVLAPESVTVNFPVKGKKDEPDTTEAVAFYELPRTDLVAFLTESLELKVVEDLDEMEKKIDPVTGDEVEVRKTRRLPFADVSEQHSGLVFKYLSKMTRGSKKPEWFAGLDIGTRGLSALVRLLTEVNHVDEVLASSGNWLMLPTIQDVLNQDEPKDPS